MTDPNKDPADSKLAQVLASYGDTEVVRLTRVQQFTVKAMSANWAAIPHVTHHDLLDVTAMETARARLNTGRDASERLSPLPFLIKASAAVLGRMERFNAAMDEGGDQILIRRYVNVGFAVDTPGGLVVPVIRGCDSASLDEISLAAKTLAEKARSRGLTLGEMSGGCFTISSLGSLGGTGFTPIINAPEVAILGVSRMVETPSRGAEGQVVWRSKLPMSLSYDHRVNNGADAGRFLAALQEELDAIATDKGSSA